jgi:hypothetical protein
MSQVKWVCVRYSVTLSLSPDMAKQLQDVDDSKLRAALEDAAKPFDQDGTPLVECEF